MVVHFKGGDVIMIYDCYNTVRVSDELMNLLLKSKWCLSGKNNNDVYYLKLDNDDENHSNISKLIVKEQSHQYWRNVLTVENYIFQRELLINDSDVYIMFYPQSHNQTTSLDNIIRFIHFHNIKTIIDSKFDSSELFARYNSLKILTTSYGWFKVKYG
jgi:hypothetical protein